ncbi:MAG: type II secretion system protein [Deltaproteobacteria bacterium]|nr:type II secretion system protein [Deltaproteobacteria bacterium]
MRSRAEKGFTLVEVMISLGILFAALVVLIGISNANVKASNRAKFFTVATFLARAKMFDLEEELAHKGFQEMEETMDGDFSEEGFPKFTWSALIEKVQLPSAGDMQNAVKSGGATKDEPAPSDTSNPLSGLLGGQDPKSAMGASALLSQFDMLAGILENAIRKVTLTLKWKVGPDEETMSVTAYFTDPKAIDQAGLMSTGGKDE